LDAANVKAVLSVLKLSIWVTINLPKGQNIDHKLVEIEDDEDEFIKPHFESCIKFIDRNLPLGNVVVHCQAGVSRSATIVIAYLMQKKGWPYL
jgi:dual specificity phosphatase 12